MIGLSDLEDLEHLLTGRSKETIAADPRFLFELATEHDEYSGVDVAGVRTVTDSFTQAIAEADPSSLPASYRAYGPDEFLRLAAVARHAIANGHHMYCLWEV